MQLKRPSASLVISILALVVASTGTAIAAGHYLITSSKQIKPGAIALGNISRSARSALRGGQGRQGPQGRPGAPGTVLGYANVAANGTLQQGRNLTGANVTLVEPGLYCFHDLSFVTNTTMASLTVFADNGASVQSIPASLGSISGCPANTDAYAFTLTSGGRTDEPFQIWFN